MFQCVQLLILTLAGARLLFATAEPHIYEAVTAVFSCAGTDFTARGKTVLAEGWKELERRYRATLKDKPEAEDGENEGVTLPELSEGQNFPNPAAKVTEHTTTPPKPHSEASLLSAMERAGNGDTDPDAERRGLGTPATRAAVIEKLVKGGFAERKGKQLIPTQNGAALISVLPDMLKTVEQMSKVSGIGENKLRELMADEYLSGNVREKLRIAHVAADQDPAFRINVEALEQVQPKDLTAGEITVRLGVTWIGPEIIKQFSEELFQSTYREQKIAVRYNEYLNNWYISNKSQGNDNIRVTNTYGTKRINGYH